MDITGPTAPRIGSPPASRPASAPAPGPQPPDIVKTNNVQPSQAAVDAIVSQNESNIRSSSRIHIDEATNQVVVEIVNAENEVIRQIPLAEALRLDVLFKQITGIIFDQQA